jgi:hypothetical protein
MRRSPAPILTALALVLTPVPAPAQEPLASWDSYTSFVLSSCVLDTLGLRTKMMAGMQARLGAGLTEHEDRDGMDYLDHPNGTVLQLSSDDTEVLCRLTIPESALSPEDALLLRDDLAEQLGYRAEGPVETSESGGDVTWSFRSGTGTMLTMGFAALPEGGVQITNRTVAE